MKPEKTKKGLTFFPVPEFSGVDAAFGADESRYFDRHDLPEVPGKYEAMANDLMFNGGSLEGISEKVDGAAATTAVRAWLSSWAPAHEAKVATVGYALWLWSDDEALSV